MPVGAQGEFKLAHSRANLAGAAAGASVAANDASLIGLGYVHNLSKRTALYGTLARVSNDGLATYPISGGPAGMAGGGHSTGYELGLRHSF